MEQSKQNNKLNPKLAKEIAWRRGMLSWLLDKSQQDLYQLFHNNDKRIHTWLLARRSGKTHSLAVLSIEYCIKHKNSIIKFVAPTKMQVERFIRPLIRQILETCPEDLKPEFRVKDSTYFFPNGSELQLCGAEGGNIESIRGGFAHIAIIDEAQDVSDLSYSVNSVLLPTTLTTGGKILLSGTPPKDMDGEFIDFVEMCEAQGTLIRKTIYENPRLTPKDIQDLKDAMGGEQSESFQRECLVKIIKDSSRSVIPEFDEEKIKTIVREVKRPPFFDAYVGMDFGYKDLTAVLFGYYDFQNHAVVFEDEITINGDKLYLEKLGYDILSKERQLWTNEFSGEIQKPKKRVADNNLIAINEIRRSTKYQCLFDPVDKTMKHAALNLVRSLINNNQIIIHPRCTTLIQHLKNARWASTTNKDTFARSLENHHYDLVDCCAYIVKSIDFSRNPFPKNYGSDVNPDDIFDLKREKEEFKIKTMNKSDNDIYRKLLNIRKGNK
jgi:hypothetical protein